MSPATKRKRAQIEVWHPKACNLQLPDVPPTLRASIRKKLSPYLAKLQDYGGDPVSVQFGDCWNIAQSLTLTARDKSVQYVEGVWSDTCVPHGWNLVDGYVVDLVDEFRKWQGDESNWLREPLKVYTFEEVLSFYDNHFGMWEVMSTNLGASFPDDDFERPDDAEAACAYCGVWQRFVFWPAIEKLLARNNEQEMAA